MTKTTRDALAVMECVCPICLKKGYGVRELFLAGFYSNRKIWMCEYCSQSYALEVMDG